MDPKIGEVHPLHWATYSGAVCWFDVCQQKKLPGMVYCAWHELLYRANHNGAASITGESLYALDKWEKRICRTP